MAKVFEIDMRRESTIRLEVDDDTLAAPDGLDVAVLDELQRLLENQDLPDGVTYTFDELFFGQLDEVE